jgi:hypothetical protein
MSDNSEFYIDGPVDRARPIYNVINRPVADEIGLGRQVRIELGLM